MTDEQLTDLVLTPGVKELVIDFLTKKKLLNSTQVSSKELSEAVKNIRDIFNSSRIRKSGGPAARLRPKLEWFISVTNYSLSEIENACRRYIDQCNLQQRFPMDAHNFVVQQDKTSKKELSSSELYEYLTNNNEPTQSTFTELL